MKRLLALLLLLPVPALAQTAVSGVYKSSPPTLTDGVQQQLRLDSTGALVVSGGASGATADQVQGNIASGVADSGNPVKTGGVANSGLPSAVTNGQRVNTWLGLNGQTMVSLGGAVSVADGGTTTTVPFTADGNTRPLAAAPMLWNGTALSYQRGDANGAVVQPALSTTFWKYAAAASGIVNTTTAVTVKAAAGASVRNYVMSMQCSHDTLGAATEFAIRDGAAGTVMWRGKLQTAATDASGATINFEPPLQGTANTLTEIVTLTAVTGGVYCNLQGYTGS